MSEKIRLEHVGLRYDDKEKADRFFIEFLEMPKVKDYTVSEDLSESIFGIRKKTDMLVYDNGVSKIEVFISENSSDSQYEHTCIEVGNKEEFIDRCKDYRIEPIIVRKEGKDLLFIRDFSGNLFEIKEKPKT